MPQVTALTHRRMLALAVPIMLANISTPLIGIVDTGVVGQLSDPSYIGAVAVGALIFSLLFWTFGFLRMGTTGLAAQSAGAADDDELAAVLLRALLVAGLCGSLLIALQWPIREAAFGLVGGTERGESTRAGLFQHSHLGGPV